MAGFAVDTHLLRELGDLLVGRDSTAILELIKNSYDADACTVTLRASNLDDAERAEIVVSDDGNGMSEERFNKAFLRIAGRDKEDDARVSPRYQRAYTGQKGIGRLASQKLAKRLDVESRPRVASGGRAVDGVRASIDWQEIDAQDTLDNLESGLSVASLPRDSNYHGTTMRLSALKREWSSQEVARFVAEVAQTQPPEFILNKPTGFVRDLPPSFDRPHLRDAAPNDPGFSVHLEGDFSEGDDPWETAASEFHWCVEVSVANGAVTYTVVPSARTVASNRFAHARRLVGSASPHLRFQARFFVLEGASTRRGPLKDFTLYRSGIRLFLEGFRVLPYGERGDDWLGLDSEYRSGARFYDLQVSVPDGDEHLESDKKEGLLALGNAGYYGGVFLTNAGAADLQSVVNREGFVPSPTFEEIKSIVQTGVRLSVRVRRAVLLQKQIAATEGARAGASDFGPSDEDQNAELRQPSRGSVAPVAQAQFPLLAPQRISAESRVAIDRAAERVAAASTPDEISAAAEELRNGFVAAKSSLEALSAIQPELRILAGVGLQLGAFVHDINGMLGSTRTIRRLLNRALETEPDRQRRRELRLILTTAEELAHVLARQSSYLTDVLSLDPRRRRARVRIKDSVESVLLFLESRSNAKDLAMHINIDPELRSPPMFPAELSVLLTNLLTNALKNAAQGGQIWISGDPIDDRGVELTISNDGTAVDLADSERWFLPFESTTVEVDEVLGQGLGLGLPIVRAIANDYNGAAWFGEPIESASTTVRVQLRERG